MTVFIVASYADSLVKFRGALLAKLVSNGYTVHVAAPQISSLPKTQEQLESLGVTWHEIELSRNGLNPIRDIATLYQIVKLCRSTRCDLFLGYTIKPVIWGLKAASLAGVEQRVALITGLGYAFTGKATGLRGFVQKIAKSLYKSSLKKASLVFFQNPDDLEELLVRDFCRSISQPKWSTAQVLIPATMNMLRFRQSRPSTTYLSPVFWETRGFESMFLQRVKSVQNTLMLSFI